MDHLHTKFLDRHKQDDKTLVGWRDMRTWEFTSVAELALTQNAWIVPVFIKNKSKGIVFK